MRKLNFMQKITIGCLLLMVIATTSLSLVFWQSGVSGSDTTTGNGLGIGQGTDIQTELEVDFRLKEGQDVNKKLIPWNRTTGTNFVHEKTFVASVKWIGTYNLNQKLDLAVGSKVEITLDSANIELNNFKNRIVVNHNPSDSEWYKNTSSYLFLIEVNHIIALSANELVTETNPALQYYQFDVEFVVRMNEPKDQEEYEKVANHYFSFAFNFKINTDDLIFTD